ncbi:hypothetical protein CAPTEDRAFT_221202 [Capitella teleta]|uniref:C2H2-type domain-containing protein n=1 Tax=Capitella teleta TaxID=283909 RepID=R7TZS9_CAPTE|nr:hypothetical protein CAPTEDRAFT_221202 [Capitella teleta]|eukprot:ELT96440.1 hypothetical protein CAPTEDRAFT_221202 [Capitella teleta]
MMTKQEHEQLQMVIKDTVRLLVKNGVNFSNQLSIQGLLAVSLDQQDMFIIHLDEHIGEGEGVCHACGQHKMTNSPASSGRARSWSESNCPAETDSEEEAEAPPPKVPRQSQKSPQPLVNNTPAKCAPQSIIIKREKGDYKLHEDWMQCPDLTQFIASASHCGSKSTSTLTAKSPPASGSTLVASASAPSKLTLLPITDILPSRKPDPNEPPYNGVHECKLCPYKSPYRGTLNRHMRVHLSDKPFKCPFCDYSSRFRSNLLQHCASLHPSERGGDGGGGGGGQLPPTEDGL